MARRVVKDRAGSRRLEVRAKARQLLFASLLLADDMVDGGKATVTAPPPVDDALAVRTERIADRLESLAAALEAEASSA